jgi:FMN phosphatase YigB (HAD superfamily)
MKLVVFDVDGTLIRGVQCEDRCYAQAFEEVAGIADLNTDWNAYEHVTDDGVASQVFRERLHRTPEAEELARIHDRFVRGLQEARVPAFAERN